MTKLQRTKQCAKCPWRKDVNPHEIPDGYSLEKHIALRATIADLYADLTNVLSWREQLRMMACHETGNDACIGWLYNQLGRGNNIWLRLRIMNCENISKLEIVGKQFDCFEETISHSKKLLK